MKKKAVKQKVKCTGVKKGCKNEDCSHRKLHVPMIIGDGEDEMLCTKYDECWISEDKVKVRCQKVTK